ncbi:hypothetical protein [Sphingobium sp. RAC03]|uniref:hypothetical protein n=1 Tax=Sphingobium sp. RAC03 TaxID=1843368 RepID=UPI00083DEBD6|nr:hypothetical protein [Sphingobium sp. RAC03]AOF95410.1 hypothetical protein BSY17_4106 [Sphingobium sp. RAC03]
MTSLLSTTVGIIAGAMALAACSEKPTKKPPTEQEIHANDSADASGTPGRHPYRCDDKRTLLIDFKDEGLTLEIRRAADGAPLVMTAPAQGLQYVGDTASATFSGNEIRIEEANEPTIVCAKATSL